MVSEHICRWDLCVGGMWHLGGIRIIEICPVVGGVKRMCRVWERLWVLVCEGLGGK